MDNWVEQLQSYLENNPEEALKYWESLEEWDNLENFIIDNSINYEKN